MPSTSVHTIILRQDHDGYPERLREMKRAPEWLALRGRLPDHDKAVAIVGPRAASTRHCELAHEFGRILVDMGILVVSGGALGVDAAAHRGAVAALEARSSAESSPGGTVAVLGCGLDVVYPERNGPLFDAIRAAGGGLLSLFSDDAPPRSWHFARRNRIMAAMSDLVVVIGAGAHSGALQTAREARTFGRLVVAMPGTPGCEALIASGAGLIRDAADLVAAVQGTPTYPERDLPRPGSPGARVLAALDVVRPRDIDDVVSCTGLPTRQVQRLLLEFELEGLVILDAGHRYRRSRMARGRATHIEVTGG